MVPQRRHDVRDVRDRRCLAQGVSPLANAYPQSEGPQHSTLFYLLLAYRRQG